MIAMWCILDKFIFSLSISFIFVTNYMIASKKYRVNSWSSVCPHGRSYFSFSRISSSLMPLASSFFSTLSASAFKASMLAVMDAISVFRDAIVSCFSAIWGCKIFGNIGLGTVFAAFCSGHR